MNKLSGNEFNVLQSDDNGRWIRVEELNKMIELGIIVVDIRKIEKYNNNYKIIKE